jgi:hypothetical protein
MAERETADQPEIRACQLVHRQYLGVMRPRRCRYASTFTGARRGDSTFLHHLPHFGVVHAVTSWM